MFIAHFCSHPPASEDPRIINGQYTELLYSVNTTWTSHPKATLSPRHQHATMLPMPSTHPLSRNHACAATTSFQQLGTAQNHIVNASSIQLILRMLLRAWCRPVHCMTRHPSSSPQLTSSTPHCPSTQRLLCMYLSLLYLPAA